MPLSSARPHLTTGERRAVQQHRESVDCRVQWLVVIEAAKSRDYPRLVGAFLRSMRISIYLVHRLVEEVDRRMGPVG